MLSHPLNDPLSAAQWGRPSEEVHGHDTNRATESGAMRQ